MLRGWSHGQEEQLSAGAPRLGGARYVGQPRAARLGVGGHPIVSTRIGSTAETLRKPLRQAQRDRGTHPGVTTGDRAAGA